MKNNRIFKIMQRLQPFLGLKGAIYSTYGIFTTMFAALILLKMGVVYLLLMIMMGTENAHWWQAVVICLALGPIESFIEHVSKLFTANQG